jgi:hypothetical protein
MDRDADKKKKKKMQEDVYTKSKVMRAPPQRKAPPMPPNFRMGKEKIEMMRRQVRSQNQIKDSQMEQVKRKNMEIQAQNQMMQMQRQNQMMQIQRQNQARDLGQMNEQNMRVQQMSRGRKA